MNVTVQIPDDLAQRLVADGGDIERQTLEALSIEAHRAGHLTLAELQRILGFETRFELDGFLKDRGVYEAYDVEDFKRDLADLESLGL